MTDFLTAQQRTEKEKKLGSNLRNQVANSTIIQEDVTLSFVGKTI